MLRLNGGAGPSASNAIHKSFDVIAPPLPPAPEDPPAPPAPAAPARPVITTPEDPVEEPEPVRVPVVASPGLTKAMICVPHPSKGTAKRAEERKFSIVRLQSICVPGRGRE